MCIVNVVNLNLEVNCNVWYNIKVHIQYMVPRIQLLSVPLYPCRVYQEVLIILRVADISEVLLKTDVYMCNV